MKKNVTTSQILQVWESAYLRLTKAQREEFKKNKITNDLCKYRLIDIKTAIIFGNKQFLPEILSYIEENIVSARKLKEEKAKRSLITRSEFESNQIYRNFVCQKGQVHIYPDKCLCVVAA